MKKKEDEIEKGKVMAYSFWIRISQCIHIDLLTFPLQNKISTVCFHKNVL